MKTNYTLKEFDEALAKDEQLKKTFLETCQKIADAGEASSDGEVIMKAAEEMGYRLSLEEIEREAASNEELNDDDLEQVAGGINIAEDEKGHDVWCITGWHCYAVTLHTDAEQGTACWSNYYCLMAYEDNEEAGQLYLYLNHK